MRRIEKEEFKNLYLKPVGWIDVRAPIEFREGSIPGAVNLPLLNDDERHAIGLTYKHQGQQAAIDLGHKIVSGPLRESRIAAWIKQHTVNPDSVIYCFRGGLRSQIVQQWLAEAGYEVPIVVGGYKALRQYLLNALEELPRSMKFQVVSAPTGSGKTQYLHSNNQPSIDLEALAHHRGSAFGALKTEQPTQSNFENHLAVELLKLAAVNKPILIEDESRRIGRVSIPSCLFETMHKSPRLRLEVSFDTRVENIYRDYISQSSEESFIQFRSSVQAISRRLGGVRTQEILNDLTHSELSFKRSSDLSSNRIWIRKILEWYYDPLYQFSVERRENKIVSK